MDNEATRAAGIAGIKETLPLEAKAPRRAEREGPRFEELLTKAQKEMEALRAGEADAAGRLEARGIRRWEDLEAALQEADRKYRSAMKLSNHLVKAYEAIKVGDEKGENGA